MSSALDILENTMSDRNETLYLRCQPITTAPPGDMPELKEVVEKYWSGKIAVKKNNNTVGVTEWFSIPYQSIRLSIGYPVNGPCTVMIEELSDGQRLELFSNAQPVFTINQGTQSNVFRWVDKN